MRKLFGIITLLALFGALFASSAEEITAGKALVDAKANCSNLNSDQLESIGEYLMELRHPGAAHDYMDNMMGGEGSQSLKNAHIQMAQVLYCGDTNVPVTYGGMMGMMGSGMMGYGAGFGGYAPSASGYGMMSGVGGMMGRGSFGAPGYGMMGNYGYGFGGWSLIDILLVVLLIGLILVVYAYAWQKFSESKRKK